MPGPGPLYTLIAHMSAAGVDHSTFVLAATILAAKNSTAVSDAFSDDPKNDIELHARWCGRERALLAAILVQEDPAAADRLRGNCSNPEHHIPAYDAGVMDAGLVATELRASRLTNLYLSFAARYGFRLERVEQEQPRTLLGLLQALMSRSRPE